MYEKTANRKQTWILLFQLLFSSSFQILDRDDFMESFYINKFSYEIDKEYLEEMLRIITYREEFFIEIVKKYSPKFDFEKMSILIVLPIYIALAEIFYFSEEIPMKVSINEAIELAKTYSADSTKKVVNWVLNNIIKDYDELKTLKDNYNWKNWYSIFKK